jgi:hypothetical protein
VVISRWIQAESDVLILEEPTAGVDVGAKTELYAAIAELCRAGRACLLLSSDLTSRRPAHGRSSSIAAHRERASGEELTSAAISFEASGGTPEVSCDERRGPGAPWGARRAGRAAAREQSTACCSS